MRLTQRIKHLEDATAGEQGVMTTQRKKRRLMELIALGTLRHKGQPERPVERLSEGELLDIIGADKEGYERAVGDFAAWWRSDGRSSWLRGPPCHRRPEKSGPVIASPAWRIRLMTINFWTSEEHNILW
jgi:hypothetical protein